MALNEYNLDDEADDETIYPQEVLKKNLLFGNIGVQGPQVPPGQTAPINAPSPINDNIKAIQTPYTASSEAQPKVVNPIQGFLQKLSGGAQPTSGGVDEYGLTKPQAAPNPGILSKILGIGLPAILGAKRGGAGMGLFGALSGVNALGENAQKQYDTQLSEYQKNRALASTNQYHQAQLAQAKTLADAVRDQRNTITPLDQKKLDQGEERNKIAREKMELDANAPDKPAPGEVKREDAISAQNVALKGLEELKNDWKDIPGGRAEGRLMGLRNELQTDAPYSGKMLAINNKIKLIAADLARASFNRVTQNEWAGVMSTLGDPKYSPKEREAMIDSVISNVKDKHAEGLALLDSSRKRLGPSSPQPSGPPSGAVGKRKASDGQLYYVDQAGNALGVAQ